MTTMMVQVLDQAESEIFFPIVNVKNQVTNEIKPQVAVFRERLDDEGMVFIFFLGPGTMALSDFGTMDLGIWYDASDQSRMCCTRLERSQT